MLVSPVLLVSRGAVRFLRRKAMLTSARNAKQRNGRYHFPHSRLLFRGHIGGGCLSLSPPLFVLGHEHLRGARGHDGSASTETKNTQRQDIIQDGQGEYLCDSFVIPLI